MRKKLIYSSAIIITSLAASSAQAIDTITISGPSGNFGDDNVTCGTSTTAGPCSFTRSFTFTTPQGFRLASIDISSIATNNPLTNIDFSSVTFNGVNFNPLSRGTQEFRNLLDQNLVRGGSNTINVMGTTGGNASFSGNLSFGAAGAVPEPATWMVMLLGMGSIGFAMRRRKSQALRVRYT